MPATENWIWQPQGLALGTLVLTITLNLLCILVVSMRTWTRWRMGTFSLDDGLMVIALGVFTACCIFTCMAVYTGLGTVDAGLEAWNMTSTIKASANKAFHFLSCRIPTYADAWNLQNIIFFQITYAWSLPFIKSSICLTMLRIITDKPLRIVIWVSMVASIASAMVGFVAVVALCQPLDYYWDTSIEGGWCASTQIITGISYLISVMAIITDWTCSLVPCYVVWNLQMKSRLKASVCGVLALGIVASAATVIRLPYLRFYNITTNYYYNVANIVLWSIVECGVGILAGSLPSLRTLLKAWIDKSSKGSSYKNTPASYGYGGTGAGSKKRTGLGESVKMGYIMPKGRGNTTLVSASRRNQGSWMELEDDNSQKHIITRTVQVSVDVSERQSVKP